MAKGFQGTLPPRLLLLPHQPQCGPVFTESPGMLRNGHEPSVVAPNLELRHRSGHVGGEAEATKTVCCSCCSPTDSEGRTSAPTGLYCSQEDRKPIPFVVWRILKFNPACPRYPRCSAQHACQKPVLMILPALPCHSRLFPYGLLGNVTQAVLPLCPSLLKPVKLFSNLTPSNQSHHIRAPVGFPQLGRYNDNNN